MESKIDSKPEFGAGKISRQRKKKEIKIDLVSLKGTNNAKDKALIGKEMVITISKKEGLILSCQDGGPSIKFEWDDVFETGPHPLIPSKDIPGLSFPGGRYCVSCRNNYVMDITYCRECALLEITRRENRCKYFRYSLNFNGPSLRQYFFKWVATFRP